MRTLTTGSHTVTGQSHPTSQARIGEEGEGPDHQPVSMEEKKKRDRFEAECIENRRENKVEGRAQTVWPKELQDGGWALPLLALGGRREQGSGARPSLSWEGLGMKELSSLMTPPHMPPRSGQNELTGKAPPVPMATSGELTKTAGSAQHRHRLHHPLIRWGAQK